MMIDTIAIHIKDIYLKPNINLILANLTTLSRLTNFIKMLKLETAKQNLQTLLTLELL